MPYWETALLDTEGARQSHGENLNHYGAVRLRVVGSGDLDIRIYSQEQTRTRLIPSLPMESSTDKQPTKLMNFIAQRAKIKFSTNEINEVFKISRIIVYTKEIYTSYPQ